MIIKLWSMTVAACAALLLAGCSSSGGAASNSSRPAQAGEQSQSTSSGSSLVAEATTLLHAAEKGLVYSGPLASTSADVSNADPTSITALTDWAGPTDSVAVGKSRHVVIISCAPGTACQGLAELSQTIMKHTLDWRVDVVEADGTPNGFVTAFQTALSKNPDAIVGIGVADTAVGAQLAEAHKRHILTVAMAVQQAGNQHYDGYITGDTNLLFALDAFGIISDSRGKAHVAVIHDTTFPNLDAGAGQLEKILARCAGCKTYAVQWTAPEAQNPVTAQAIVAAALRAHPDVDYIVLPYDSLGVSATVAAIRSVGRSDIKVVAKDGTPSTLQLVKSGQVAFDAGFDSTWLAYVAVDQVARGIGGAQLIAEDKQGLPIHMFTPENTPANGQADFTSLINYKSRYESMWRGL